MDRPVQSGQGALDEIHKQRGGSQDDSVKEIGALRDSNTLEKLFGMMQNLQFTCQYKKISVIICNVYNPEVKTLAEI